MTVTAYKEPPEFLAFCEKYGNDDAVELLERICDAQCNDGIGEGVTMDVYQHDACNHTLSGCIEHDGQEFYFIIDNGNWGGTEVKQFGGPDDVGVYEPPPPLRYTLVPIAANLSPGMRKVYEAWKQEPWFKKLISDYAYDSHFAPGVGTRKHYYEKAAAKGLKFELIDE